MFTKMKTRSRLIWISLALLIALVIFGLFGARLLLPYVEKRVSSLLGLEINIERFGFSPFQEKLTLDGLVVGQPDGFGDEPLLVVDRAVINGWSDLLSHQRKFDNVRLDGTHIHLTTTEGGRNNLLSWIESSQNKTAPQDNAEGNALLVNRIEIHNLNIEHLDRSMGNPHSLKVVDSQLTIDRFAWGEFKDVDSGLLVFSGELEQEGVTHAPLYTVCRFAFLGAGEPALRASLRGTGFLFNTFVPVIPPETGLILGGEGFDALAEISFAHSQIDVTASVVTSRGGDYTAQIEGSPEEPRVTMPRKLQSVTSRMSGELARILGSAFHGGAALLEGTVGTIGEVGKGTLGTAGTLLKGIGGTALGIVTLDSKKATTGLSDLTVGVGRELAGTIEGSADELGKAGGTTIKKIVDDPRTERWLLKTPERHQNSIKDLRTTVLAEPFPP